MEEHADVQKRSTAFLDDHDALMSGLLKLRDSLAKPK
jgi:hypothetical protein